MNKNLWEIILWNITFINKNYEKIEKQKNEHEKKFKAMEEFMKANFKKDLIESYKQQSGN